MLHDCSGCTGLNLSRADMIDGKAELEQARSRTVWQALCDAGALDPDKVALIAADDAGHIQLLTYRDLLTRIRNFSAGLASIGVEHGDRVILWMTNRLEWVISAFAAERIGAVVVPINTFLKPPEVAYCIRQSGARHLIMLDRFRKLDLTAMLAEIAPELPELENIVVFAREGTSNSGTHDWASLEAATGDWLAVSDKMEQAVTPGDLLLIKYTSGSTGFPKGVMLQQGGWLAVGLLHGRRTGMRREDVYFSMMPFFHAGGNIYGIMSMLPIGGTLVFTEAFDVELALTLISQERPTILVTVLGKEVVMAAYERGMTFPSVRLGYAHNEAAKIVMPNAHYAFSPFGLTETYGPASLTAPGDPADKQMVTSGRPLPGNEIRVVDPHTGQECAPGEVGEAWIRGNIMLGYWDKPEETARALDADGWLHSEDLISIDEDGFIKYVGRMKLMAKVGGENVSLEEVELAVKNHEAITHCAAVSVADPRKVEAVRIYVIAREDMSVSGDELRTWLKPRLAHFKLPRDIAFVDDLPWLDNGKLDRMALAEWAKQEIAA
jgi:fatty-acyl-CoA synthase